MKVIQSCPILCNPMDYAVHGILQARILEWVAFSFSRGSSQARDRAQVSCIAGRIFTSWVTREALNINTNINIKWASQVVLVIKNLPVNAGDIRDVFHLWMGRSPGGRHGNPLQYSCLETPMDRGAWQATVHRVPKSQTWHSDLACMHAHKYETQSYKTSGR